MIKSILVALDDSRSNESAKKLSVLLTNSHKASLTGIGVLDEPWIAAPEAIPLGGVAFKVDLDAQFLEDAKHHIHKIEREFTKYCKSHNIDCTIVDATGVPAYEIEHFVTEYDLLIIGKDANFHFTATEDTSISIKQIIRDNPRPLIVTGGTLPNQDSPHILVAYDGTFASSRALHLALLLNIFKGKTVHVVSISSNEEEARCRVTSALKLCQNYGVRAHIHPIGTSQKPSKVLLELMDDLKPSLVVMGAFGHRGISSFFRGSCAKDLLKSTDIPLFIYH